MSFHTAGMSVLAILGWVFTVALTIFWIVVAWRALRALEGIDESLRERKS
jgi:hypothetical protein